jgi:hypothetical protein
VSFYRCLLLSFLSWICVKLARLFMLIGRTSSQAAYFSLENFHKSIQAQISYLSRSG